MISEINPYNNWNGDGSATQFDFDFYIEDSSQLEVYHIASNGEQTELTYGVDYSINEFKNEKGSYITFPIAGSSYNTLANGETISLRLTLPISQQNPFGKSSFLNLKTLEYALDYLTRICQIMSRKLERSAKVPEGADMDTDELAQDVITVANDKANIDTVATDLNNGNDSEIKKVNLNKTNIDAVAGSIANVNTVGNNLRSQGGSINTVYDDIKTGGTGYVKTVADDLLEGDDSEIKKVNANKTNIDTVVTNIVNVNTVGNNLRTQGGSINTVYDDIKTGGTGYVKTVADDLNSNGSKVKTVAQNITAVVYAGNDLATGDNSKIKKVADDLLEGDDSEIKKVNANKTNIDTVATDLNMGDNSEIKKVNLNKTNIDTVVTNIADIGTCASNMSDIEAASANALSAAASATTATNQAIIATNQAALAKQYAEETHGASDVTVSNLRASSAYRNYEYPQTDAQGLADVNYYAHSTFDSSKFTNNGAIITNDGIASFSSNNYVGVNNIAGANCDSYEIDLGMITTTDYSYTKQILLKCPVGILYLQSGILYCKYGTFNTFYTKECSDIIIEENKNYWIKVGNDGSSDYVKFSADGINYLYTFIANNPAPDLRWIYIGNSYDDSAHFPLLFPYDLKQLSIRINGKLSFIGSQTSIDTVKSNYTPLPTSDPVAVTPDGIASGFSATKYITSDYELTTSYSTLEIDLGEVTIDSLPASDKTMWLLNAIETNSGISKGFWFGINGSGRSRFFAGSGSSNYDIANSQVGSIVYAAGQKVKFKLVYNGTQYVLYSSVNGGAWTQDGNAIISDKKINFDVAIKIGTDGSANAFQGSLDLNTFKIIKDGEIVWQPCLKIPYTQSKTGSKIVDAAYRYRVTDMYEQYGYAPYYTLSDTDFTLPQGELYGIIENKVEEYNGQWVYKILALVEEQNTNSTNQYEEYEFAVDSYLPDDCYNYEVIIEARCTAGDTIGDEAHIFVNTDIIGYPNPDDYFSGIKLCDIQTVAVTAFKSYDCGNTILPVGLNRKILFRIKITGAYGEFSLYLKGYRRIGKNN